MEGLNDELIFDGDKQDTKNVLMIKEQHAFEWMYTKYGGKSQPWEYSVTFPNIEGGVDAVWLETAKNNRFSYKYGKRNRMKNEMKWEREPKRTLNIQNASDYKGQLGLQGNDHWHNTDKVFIVNGQCNKADGNFLSPFFYKEIGDL